MHYLTTNKSQRYLQMTLDIALYLF